MFFLTMKELSLFSFFFIFIILAANCYFDVWQLTFTMSCSSQRHTKTAVNEEPSQLCRSKFACQSTPQ